MPYSCAGPKFLGGGIHKLIMGKLQGLHPCNFQGNSWKLWSSTIQVIGKLQAYGLKFSGELLETGSIHNLAY